MNMIRAKPNLPIEKEQEVLLTNDGWLVSLYCNNPIGTVRELNRL